MKVVVVAQNSHLRQSGNRYACNEALTQKLLDTGQREMHQDHDKDIYSPTNLLFNRSVYKLKASVVAPC